MRFLPQLDMLEEEVGASLTGVNFPGQGKDKVMG